MFSINVNNYSLSDSQSGLTCYVTKLNDAKEASFDWGNCRGFEKAMDAVGVKDSTRFTMIIMAMRIGAINADEWARFQEWKKLHPLAK